MGVEVVPVPEGEKPLLWDGCRTISRELDAA